MGKVYKEDSERTIADTWRKNAGLTTEQMGHALGMKGRAGWEKWQRGETQLLRPGASKRLRDLLSRDPASFSLDDFLAQIDTVVPLKTGDPAIPLANELQTLVDTLKDPAVDHVFKATRLLSMARDINSERRRIEIRFKEFADKHIK